ncbi:MAG: DUF1570 domain-containing protein [Planctomycetes bacterium]|nr:DUF1570 domain-containing protein [Planctomycetota bacterium]
MSCSPVPVLRAAGVCLLGVLVAQDVAKPGDPAAFLDVLQRCRRLADNGDWTTARRSLRALLDEHGPAPYVLARAAELREDLKRAAFHATAPMPDPATLIRGEIRSLDRRTGFIRLRYRKETLADFERQAVAGRTLWIHPLQFTGSHALTVRGSGYPSDEAVGRVLACLAPQASLDLVFGAARTGPRDRQQWIPASATAVVEGRQQELAVRDDVSLVPGKPFSFVATITDDAVELTGNGVRIARVEHHLRPGQVAWFEQPFDELEIEGRCDLAWLRSREDTAQQQAFTAFEARWEAAPDVPAWLLPATPMAEAAAPVVRRWPGQPDAGHRALAGQASELLRAGKLVECMRFVNTQPRAQLPSPLREWLLGQVCVRMGELPVAVAHFDTVLAADPQFTEGRWWRANALHRQRRFAEAERDYAAVLAACPDHASAAHDLVVLLLTTGNPGPAKEVADRAAQAGVDGEAMAPLRRLLVAAAHGPAWARTFEHRTRHYVVRTDLDDATAAAAAATLEAAFLAYERALGVTVSPLAPLSVFVFSGEAGYRRYVADIEAGIPMHTSGLYCPQLKQLLAWNPLEPTALHATLRHEGLHQYLDSIAADPPVWFNEGLAEYFEQGRMVGGWFTAATVRRDHLEALRRRPPRRLGEFLRAGAFYDEPERNYAQAWAFVHFLRHGEPAPHGLFERLLRACGRGVAADEIVDEVFDDVDLAQLDRAFTDYLAGLAAPASPR